MYMYIAQPDIFELTLHFIKCEKNKYLHWNNWNLISFSLTSWYNKLLQLVWINRFFLFYFDNSFAVWMHKSSDPLDSSNNFSAVEVHK